MRTQRSSIFQQLFRIISAILVRIYYPRILITGREKVPDSGPVLIVANHANSLIDPVMVSMASKRPVKFLAKAPLFAVPLLGYLLRQLGMLPAFRGSDDLSQVKRSLESLAAGASQLSQCDVLGIFPEGKSHDSLKLAMIRSGAARMAMMAHEQGAQSLKIVPIGINYERKERFPSSVWISIGEPIAVDEFTNKGEDSKRRALRELTAAIEQRLKSVVIHVDDARWEPFVYYFESILPPSPATGEERLPKLRQRQRVASGVNWHLYKDRAQMDHLAGALEQHCHRLAVAGLEMDSPIVRFRGGRVTLQLVLSSLRLVLALIPMLLGTIFHLVPFVTVRLLANKVKAPGKSTVSLARLGFGLPLYGIWYAFMWWRLQSYFLPWLAWTCILTMPALGLLALSSWRRARSASLLLWHQLRLLAHRSALWKFRAAQEQLCKRFEHLLAHVNSPAEALPALSPSKRRAAAIAALSVIAGACLWAFSEWINWKHISPPDMGIRRSKLALSKFSPEVLKGTIERDEKIFLDVSESLRDLEVRALSIREQFLTGQRSFYSQADNDAIRQLLLSYLNCRTALLRILWRYENHADLHDGAVKKKSFILACAAGVTLYDASLKFVILFSESNDAMRKLNEPDLAWNVPANLFDTVKSNLLNHEIRQRLTEAIGRYQSNRDSVGRDLMGNSAVDQRLYTIIDSSIASLSDSDKKLSQIKESVVPPEVLARGSQTIYDAKSVVATWIGDTKIREPRSGKPLIQAESLKQLRTYLRPGDILLERRNWFISNAFLPGYWPHSALYVGTPEDVTRMRISNDPRVQRKWASFARNDENGHQHVIIEAISEGVVFTSLEHSAGEADSVAILRPALDESTVAECIAKAFSHVGKPYDFDFDFFSTDKLVCTELIYRAYGDTLNLPLVTLMGRKTMPAVELVRKYSIEQIATKSELSFVAFLDGDESTGRAAFRDGRSFLETLNRPALVWLQ